MYREVRMDGCRGRGRVGTQDCASRQPMEARADLSTRPCIPVCPLAWGIRELGVREGNEKGARALKALSLFYESSCQIVPSNTI